MISPTILAVTLLLTPNAAPQSRGALDAPAEVARLSTSACYAIANGTLQMPDGPASEPMLNRLGLAFGVPSDATKQGPVLTTLISRATLGSETLSDGQILFADGGARGCRIILLGEKRTGQTDLVADALAEGGRRAVPSMTVTRGAIERRAFLRRDTATAPYLLNLMTVLDQPGRLRLFTTVARIPPNVTLPAGY